MRDLQKENVPYVNDVGTFVLVRVIADTREKAVKAAWRVTKDKGFRPRETANVTAQSADEWLIEVRLDA